MLMAARVLADTTAQNLTPGDRLVVLDVRPAAEHAAGHLPGAVSIPVGELRRRLAELPGEDLTDLLVFAQHGIDVRSISLVRLAISSFANLLISSS